MYVVVSVGETTRVPFTSTLPIPLISTDSALDVAYRMVALSPARMFAGETEHAVNCAAGCSSTTMVVVAVASPLRLRAVKTILRGAGRRNSASSVARHGAEFRDRHGIRIQHLPVESALLARCNAIRASLEADDLNRLRRRSW